MIVCYELANPIISGLRILPSGNTNPTCMSENGSTFEDEKIDL